MRSLLDRAVISCWVMSVPPGISVMYWAMTTAAPAMCGEAMEVPLMLP